MENREKCKTSLVPDPEKGWKLRLSGDCGGTLKEINSRLGPHGRRYLEKRLVFEPEA